ncbi:MAG: hypothetical protein A2X12_06870 [Bacteroidetes bacterium GWE2_29_8]|nr:MAG: hypothetical protein A2X12_06870 [Bacteroidetes bacterium GWE2_29_8]OFY21182.1 MAG: hypothetical protein A2X02_10205 [Bacteroidetes bacterium GWF2_29_10]
MIVIITIGIKTSNAQDFISKKNSEEIKAKVLEVTQTEIKYKKFDNINGPIYTINKSDVFSIKYENGTSEIITPLDVIIGPEEKEATPYIRTEKKYKEKRYIGIVETSYGLGINDYTEETSKIKAVSINGYKFTSFFSISSGVGLHTIGRVEEFPTIFMPLFMDFRLQPFKTKISPYFSLGIGYSILLIDNEFDNFNKLKNVEDYSAAIDYKGGLIFSPAAGIRLKLANSYYILLGINYETQWIKKDIEKDITNYINYNYEYKTVHSSKNYKLGYLNFVLSFSY